MKGYKCDSCGKVYTYKRKVCIKCGKTSFSEVDLGEEARLITYTVLYVVPAGIERSPLVLGIAEFKDGARLFGQVMTDKPQVGMKLKAQYGKLRTKDGKELNGYYFVPE
ncbi:MAG: Zn-ribbon domain-containing OB-fold protein [Nitrososphaeria archaeon]|nr:OB-fold domain-containing protein [Conexivisphaerales archaeon]